MLIKRFLWTLASITIIVILIGISVIGFNYYEPNQQHAEQEAKEQSESKAIEILASERVAYYTKALAIFTGALAGFGIVQILFLIRAENTARKSANAAKESADAAVNASKPFLYPRVTQAGMLHPNELLPEGITIIPEIRFVFENYGNTPAIIREIRASLYLSEIREALPPIITIDNLKIIEHEAAVIPGKCIGPEAIKATGNEILCKFNRPLTHDEMKQVISGVSGGQEFRRFFMMVFIIYDDFFGMECKQRFCLKLRSNGFQAIKGGRDYNSIERKKIEK